MKYSLNWVKQFVTFEKPLHLEELKEGLWESLAEIESVTDLTEAYKGVLIGKIEKIEKHPKSEKLLIVKLNVGKKEPATVVTGAHNISEGDFVPYLPPQSKVPRSVLSGEEPVVLAEKPMMGILSQGMLASRYELNLGDDHSGIMILPQTSEYKYEPGAEFAKTLGLDDSVIEIENKSMTHRGDAFSIIGVAREVAAITSNKFNPSAWLEPSPAQLEEYADEFDKKLTNKITLSIEAPDALARYSAVVLEGIQIKESPLWLQIALLKHDIKPIYNVVDITNYIMLEWGQPLHAFDAKTVTSNDLENGKEYMIVVRKAKSGEKILALDNKEHILEENTLLIADKKKALGVAGIIGGAESAITSDTKTIILESATFDMYSIRKTSMQQGLFTDASTVFSRKQDPTKTVKAMLRAIELLKEYAGATVASPIADYKNYNEEKREIVISAAKAKKFLGIEIDVTEIAQILESLQYKVIVNGDLITLDVPSYRLDVIIDEDVYEDIIRIKGYNRITPELPKRPIYAVSYTQEEKLLKKVRDILTASGFLETISFAFVSSELYEKAGISADDCYNVINAVSPDVQYVRKLIAPALLKQGAENQYNASRFGIYEIGKTARKGYVYGKTHADIATATPMQYGQDDFNLPIEDKHIGMIVVAETEKPVYYELKQYIDQMLKMSITGEIQYKHVTELPEKMQKTLPLWIQDTIKMTKGGRTAIIVAKYQDELTLLGALGEINALTKKNFGFQKEAAIAELHINQVQSLFLSDKKYKEPSKYPAISVDYCFEIPKETTYMQMMDALQNAARDAIFEDKPIVSSIMLVDIFSKDDTNKRMTFSVKYQSKDKTLNDREISDIKKKFVASVEAAVKGKLV